MESEDKGDVEEVKQQSQRRQRFFWLPNAITICGLFSGLLRNSTSHEPSF